MNYPKILKKNSVEVIAPSFFFKVENLPKVLCFSLFYFHSGASAVLVK